MDQNQNKNGFSYTYSAKEQAEIKSIRQKYIITPPKDEENKMEKLRRLDRSVTKKGMTISLIIGIISTLVLGTGMSIAMTELGSFVGNQTSAMLLGIAIGLVGIVGIVIAYPIYNLVTEKQRKKIAPEIIRLADELSR